MKNTSTITKKGQITIPKDIRDDLSLSPSQKVTFYKDGDRIIVVPVTPISELAGSLKNKSKNATKDLKEIRKKVQEDIAENAIKEME